MKLSPLYDDTAPLACTISEAELPGRVELVERMRSHLERLERTEHGMLLHFLIRPDIEDDLQRFAVDEKRCCEFWGFEVISGDGDLILRWDAPPSGGELIDRLEEFFAGDEPVSVLVGLL